MIWSSFTAIPTKSTFGAAFSFSISRASALRSTRNCGRPVRARRASAVCKATSAAPDLRLDIADLGAVYLGGTRPSLLAEAGRIMEERSGALRLADRLFAAEMAPFCTVQF